MMPVWFLIFFVGSGLFFGLGLFAAFVAWVKEYRPWFWLFSLGPIGALLMVLRPNLNRATTPEEREQWEQRADWMGGILSGITLFFGVMPLAGMLLIFSIRSVAIVPVPVMVVGPPAGQTAPVERPQVSPAEGSNQTPPP